MEHRAGDPGPGALIPIPPLPAPPPVSQKVPGRIPWISEESTYEVGPEPGREATPVVRCFWCNRLHLGKHPLSVCTACEAGYSTMRSLQMSGSYPLTRSAIEAALRRTSPGNYALGYMDDGNFIVFYVGRSDSDVKGRLHEWVGMPSRYGRYASAAKAPWGVQPRERDPLDAPALDRVGNADTSYTRFAYSYAHSVEEAYAKEWRNFEAFGGSRELDNETQPASAGG